MAEALERKMEEEKKMENPVDLRIRKTRINRANTAKNRVQSGKKKRAESAI